MKKIVYAMYLLLPAVLLMGASDAVAQRKNHTKADVPTAMEQADKSTCGCGKMSMDKNCACAKKMDGKEMMKTNKLMDKSYQYDKDKADIEEDYQEALEKVNKSSFSEANKKILKNQAGENRDLALKQAKMRNDLRVKHIDARKNMKEEMLKDKKNRKAVKEIMSID